MDPFYKDLALASQWNWDHRNSPQYWTWQALTDQNNDPTALNLTKATAWNIVTVLEGKGLILSLPPLNNDQGERIEHPFKLNLSDEKA